jgi:hypothetical protein
MPYIAPDRRTQLDGSIAELQTSLRALGNSEGDLNYVITRLIAAFFLDMSRYAMIARIDGVLGDVGKEFYRRVASLYEDSAFEKNGDIPEYKEFQRRFANGAASGKGQ